MRERVSAVIVALSSVFLGLGATVSAVAADAPTGPALVATQTDYKIHAGDTLLVGRESAGVPQTVHDVAYARLLIPLRAGLRSLNVAQAAAMVLGEALRQTRLFPKSE